MTITQDGSGINRGGLLSVLWIFVSINFVFCDVVSLMDGRYLKELLDSPVLSNGVTLDAQTLLFFSIFLEIAFLMIVLSRVLGSVVNRVTNIIASILLVSLQIWSLFGENMPHYVFFSIVEIGAYIAIFVIAATWRREQQ